MITYFDYLMMTDKDDSRLTYIDFLMDIDGNTYDEAASYITQNHFYEE